MLAKASFPFDLIATQSNPEHFANDPSGQRINPLIQGTLILLLIIGIGIGLS